MTAPAAMPSEEDVARVIAQNPPNRSWEEHKDSMRLVRDHLPTARAILALFAPILAEKERLEDELEGTDWHAIEAGRQRDVWKARALAAEAALAAERERCAKVVEFITDPDQDAGSFDPKHCQNVASDAFNDHPARATMNARLKSYGAAIAASIRAQGE